MSSLKRTTVQRVLIGVSILLFLLPPATWAQFDVGSVVGVIKDPSGSVLPNAAVEIKSLATNVVRTAVTSAAGEFDFIALQPGQYSITVKVQGFKVSTQNFALSVGQRL